MTSQKITADAGRCCRPFDPGGGIEDLLDVGHVDERRPIPAIRR
jgi:hypothetical protein